MDMAQRLREKILSVRTGRADLCSKTGVSESTLSKFLAGKQDIQVSTFEALAAAVGLDLVDREHASIFEDERVRHGRIAFATRDNAAFVADLIPSENTIDAAAMLAGETGRNVRDVLTEALADRCADELQEAGIIHAMLRSRPEVVLGFWTIYRRATEGQKGYRLIKTSIGFIPCNDNDDESKRRAENWLQTAVEFSGGYTDAAGNPSKTPRKK